MFNDQRIELKLKCAGCINPTQVGWILFTKKNVPKGRYYISYMDAILGGAWKGAKERTKHPFIKKSQGATLTIRSAQLSIRYGYAQIFVPCQTAKPVDTVWLLVFSRFSTHSSLRCKDGSSSMEHFLVAMAND